MAGTIFSSSGRATKRRAEQEWSKLHESGLRLAAAASAATPDPTAPAVEQEKELLMFEAMAAALRKKQQALKALASLEEKRRQDVSMEFKLRREELLASWEPDENIGQELMALKQAAKERTKQKNGETKSKHSAAKEKDKQNHKMDKKAHKRDRRRHKASSSYSCSSASAAGRKAAANKNATKKEISKKHAQRKLDKAAPRKDDKRSCGRHDKRGRQKKKGSSESSYSGSKSSDGKRHRKDESAAASPNPHAAGHYQQHIQHHQAMQQWQYQQQQQQAAQYHQQMQHWHYMQQWQAHQHHQQQLAARQQHEQHQMMIRQQEEEKQRREEDEQKLRIEEQNRRRAQELENNKRRAEATSAIMKVIQKVRVATPESFDDLKKELDEVFARELEFTGPQKDQMLDHKTKALEMAQSCVEKINALRQSKQIKHVAPSQVSAIGFSKARLPAQQVSGEFVKAAPPSALEFTKAASSCVPREIMPLAMSPPPKVAVELSRMDLYPTLQPLLKAGVETVLAKPPVALAFATAKAPLAMISTAPALGAPAS